MSHAKEVLRRACCCACGRPMAESPHCNLVQTDRRATWEYPRGGNLISGWGPAAMAIVCDECVNSDDGLRIQLGVEVREGLVYYHRLDELEQLPPEPTYQLVRMGTIRDQVMHSHVGIRCLRCGFLSWNRNDVRNKYCGRCRAFHEG